MSIFYFSLCILLTGLSICLARPRSEKNIYSKIHDTKIYSNQPVNIIGGKPTSISKHPYQVAIIANGTFLGAGIILENTWVATLASMVLNIPANDTSVVAGSNNYTTGNSYGVREIMLHPDFDFYKLDNDIALLKLSRKLPFSKRKPIKKISIGSKLLPDGSQLMLSGWGDTSKTNKTNPKLTAVTLKTVNINKCKSSYSGYTISSSMMCASGKNVGPCWSDFGDVITHNKKAYGLFSWSIGCAVDGYPGIFTDLVSLNTWIKSVVHKNKKNMKVGNNDSFTFTSYENRKKGIENVKNDEIQDTQRFEKEENKELEEEEENQNEREAPEDNVRKTLSHEVSRDVKIRLKGSHAIFKRSSNLFIEQKNENFKYNKMQDARRFEEEEEEDEEAELDEEEKNQKEDEERPQEEEIEEEEIDDEDDEEEDEYVRKESYDDESVKEREEEKNDDDREEQEEEEEEYEVRNEGLKIGKIVHEEHEPNQNHHELGEKKKQKPGFSKSSYHLIKKRGVKNNTTNNEMLIEKAIKLEKEIKAQEEVDIATQEQIASVVAEMLASYADQTKDSYDRMVNEDKLADYLLENQELLDKEKKMKHW